MEFTFWILVGFLSGSIPWSVLVGKFLAGLDVRSVGDGNPGSANVWKGSGSAFGVLALILDITKGFVPVYVGFSYLSPEGSLGGQLALSLVAFAPILGHAFSPFLKFSSMIMGVIYTCNSGIVGSSKAWKSTVENKEPPPGPLPLNSHLPINNAALSNL